MKIRFFLDLTNTEDQLVSTLVGITTERARAKFTWLGITYTVEPTGELYVEADESCDYVPEQIRHLVRKIIIIAFVVPASQLKAGVYRRRAGNLRATVELINRESGPAKLIIVTGTDLVRVRRFHDDLRVGRKQGHFTPWDLTQTDLERAKSEQQ